MSGHTVIMFPFSVYNPKIYYNNTPEYMNMHPDKITFRMLKSSIFGLRLCDRESTVFKCKRTEMHNCTRRIGKKNKTQRKILNSPKDIMQVVHSSPYRLHEPNLNICFVVYTDSLIITCAILIMSLGGKETHQCHTAICWSVSLIAAMLCSLMLSFSM